MIYSLCGKLLVKKPSFIVVEANGIGFKIFICSRTYKKLSKIGSNTRIFCSVNFYKNGIDFYGFLKEKERDFFELINSTPGIGPKSALAILDNFSEKELSAVVNESRADLLSKAWGVGQKKAERLILELKNKIKKTEAGCLPTKINLEIEAALKSLGYKQNEIKEVVKNLPQKIGKLEERLKWALKLLGRTRR